MNQLMHKPFVWTALIGAVLFLAVAMPPAEGRGAANAQAIQILVNNEALQPDATPLVVSGHLLVPLRGIFERLNAALTYDPLLRSIRATRGDTVITLQVGNRYATVNGTQVWMDVTPLEWAGRIFVPLRFVSQALGAQVFWNRPNRLVMINSTAAPIALAQPVPFINTLTHNANTPLRPGNLLEVMLTGDTGGIATFDVAGLADGVAMTEGPAGTYRGSFLIPQGTRQGSFMIIGHLVVSDRPAAVKTVAFAVRPATGDYVPVRSIVPASGSTAANRRPTISAVFDTQGQGTVDPASVQILVNGENVERKATITPTYVVYNPAQDLPIGVSMVEIRGEAAGAPFSRRWDFQVVAEGNASISAVMHSAQGLLRRGNVLTVFLIGTPSGQATFDLGTFRVGLPMSETTRPGTYQGTYRVKAEDEAKNLPVWGRLQVGQSPAIAMQADGLVSLSGSESAAAEPSSGPVPLTVLWPSDGQTVDAPIQISGSTQPGASVEVSAHQLVQLNPGGPTIDLDLGSRKGTADPTGEFLVELEIMHPTPGSLIYMWIVARNQAGTASPEVTLTSMLR